MEVVNMKDDLDIETLDIDTSEPLVGAEPRIGGNSSMKVLVASTPDANKNQRLERKNLVTIVEWEDASGKSHAQIMGARVEDSAVEFNPDMETITDILGQTYTDVNKTEPQQDMEFNLLSNSELGAYMSQNALENNILAYNNIFNVYLVFTSLRDAVEEVTEYYAVKHEQCSIIPTNIGGSSWVTMSVEVHFSNKITKGTVKSIQPTAEGKVDFTAG